MNKPRITKSRKAMIFNITIVVLTIMILTYGYIRMSAKTSVEKEIGETSMEIIAKVQEGEKALVFLDFAAKMAVYQAIYDLQNAGGIAESSSCGSYYGFNRWNSDSGQQCFVDSATAKDSLRDLFVSDLVARVAAYPSADFIGNVPTAAFSRGMAAASGDIMGIAAPAPEGPGPACTAGEEFTRDFTYPSDSGFFPENGGRVWVPQQANCAGSYPMIIFLHGCQGSSGATSHRHFGDQLDNDIIPLTKQLVQTGTIQPVILAAPSQTRGDATVGSDTGNSACGGSLWGSEFDAARFKELVLVNLPTGVQISSVSLVGYAEAGCSNTAGIHRAASTLSGLTAIGQFDSCLSDALGQSMNEKLGTSTKFLTVYGTTDPGNIGAHRTAMEITTETNCPSTAIPGARMSDCFSGSNNNHLAFKMEPADHGKALSLGMEQFLKNFYAAGAAAVPAANQPAGTPATPTLAQPASSGS